MENGGGGIMKKEKKEKDKSVSVSNVYRLEGRVPVSRGKPVYIIIDLVQEHAEISADSFLTAVT